VIPIQPVGGFHPMDAEGRLLNDAGANRIAYPWRHVVDASIEALRDFEGENLLSVFVRGSVAQGTARFGVSDVDMVGVTRAAPARVDVGARELLLEARFPFCTGVELVRTTKDDLLSSPETPGLRFALAVLGACVHGENMLPLLPRYTPGVGTAFYASTIGRRLDHFRQSMRDDGLTRWMGKSLVRGGFDLVMARERKYTSHVLLCWERFSAHYPAWRDRMRVAVEATINPPAEFLGPAEDLTEFVRSEWEATPPCDDGGRDPTPH
jgi:hypothetical protein